ncbi:kinase [Acidocella aquatica]|uniref:Kinase n=1 Tax=Acidocella aquatica TaxID=1922313 RepID=A0ABQ6A2T3_9PROT|nr:bifunctional aminoglycoside phosphotransferase/ATP-binding protein [Acidocella aquatica]GLR66789.1 kinase [Acidocella aquatica]
MAEAQAEVIAFLSDGAGYGAPGGPVERIETHISIVFLVGERAYKLKRAVRFSYVDYSTLALRETYCRRELELNRRSAPELYLRVRAITHVPGGGLEFDGTGQAVDFVLEMRRFAQESLLDRLADCGGLTPGLMRDVTDTIAAFHEAAAAVPGFGGAAVMRAVIAGNAENLSRAAPLLDGAAAREVSEAALVVLETMAPLLEARKAAGKVRRCHGDLHLRNICLLEGKPLLFDCIEFNEAFSCIDVLYDLAFLLMDLLHRGFSAQANAVCNRYLDRTGDWGGVALLPLFISMRAAVRAHVLVAQYCNILAAQTLAAARAYLALAGRALVGRTPFLVAIGGLSGTGKSTVAAALAGRFGPVPGARVIRSDVVRKMLSGVAPEVKLPATAYDVETSARVYAAMWAQARAVLAAGCPVILDAAFLAAGMRAEARALAARAGVGFCGVWLQAPVAVLEARLAERRGDASDADVLVMRGQAVEGVVDWLVVDAAAGVEAQVERILDAPLWGASREAVVRKML